MASLTEFKSHMKSGMMRLNHYKVEMTLPPTLVVEPFISNSKKITAFCDQAQIPGVSFATSQVRSYGEYMEVPYEKLYEPVNLSFYVDDLMITKSLFDTWMNLVQNGNTRKFNFPEVYMSDKITITLENTQDVERYRVELFKCYPKSIAAVQLDYGAKDLMRINVVMQYKYFKVSANSSPEGQGLQVEKTPYTTDYTYGYELDTNSSGENFFRDYSSIFYEMNDMSIYDVTFDGARSAFNGASYSMEDILDTRKFI